MRSTCQRRFRSTLQESLLTGRGERNTQILGRFRCLSQFLKRSSSLRFPLEVIPDSREYAFHQIFEIGVSQSLAFRGVSQLAEEMRELGKIDFLSVFALK